MIHWISNLTLSTVTKAGYIFSIHGVLGGLTLSQLYKPYTNPMDDPKSRGSWPPGSPPMILTIGYVSLQTPQNSRPPCTAFNGWFPCCWFPSRWTRPCSTITSCSWCSISSASSWRKSPAPSAVWCSSPPSSSYATQESATASFGVATVIVSLAKTADELLVPRMRSRRDTKEGGHCGRANEIRDTICKNLWYFVMATSHWGSSWCVHRIVLRGWGE